MSDPNAQPPYDAGAGNPAQPPYTPPAGQVPPQYGTPGAGQVPPPAYTPGTAASSGAPLSQSDDKLWASLAHFGGVLNFIPPLIIWLIFKDRGPLTNQEGKESLNYQITIAIAWVAYSIIGVILAFIPIIGGIIATILWLAVLAAQVVFPIVGGVKVQGGASYRYPFAIRFIK
jgi:uncharacterized Tic20 family protein